MSLVSPAATVHSGAIISDNVKISAFAIIEDGVYVGEGTEIKEGVIIRKGTSIGRWNKIFPYAIIGEVPQDIQYNGEKTRVIVGDNNIIREFVTIHRGSKDGDTIIGNNNYIMAYVHIGHNVNIGSNTRLVNGATLGGWVEVQDCVYISALVPVHPFVRIGSYAMVGGGYRVVKDVLPFALVAGEPLRTIGVNIEGLKYHKFSAERMDLIKEAFKDLFGSGLNTNQALEKIKDTMNPDIIYLINFIQSSKRGITGGGRKVMKENKKSRKA